MTEHEVFETRLRTALARHVANAPTDFDALEFARAVAAAEPRRRGRVGAIAAALGGRPGAHPRWWSVLVPPAYRSPARRVAWIVALVGLLMAATVSAFFAGSELLRRPNELSVVPPGTTVLTIAAHPEGVSTIAWSPEGGRLATANRDGPVKVWDADTGDQLLFLDGRGSAVLGYSPDGTRLASGMVVLDATTGDELFGLPDGFLAYSPDGTHIAAGGAWGWVGVIDATTGEVQLEFPLSPRWMSDAAWSPDGTRLATVWASSIKIWDATTGDEQLMFGPYFVTDVEWSPDGTRIVTAGGDAPGPAIWDAATGDRLATLTGHTIGVAAISWSPDGTRIASAGRDGTARIWDAATGGELATFTGHTQPLTDVAWSPDSTRIATASEDGTAKIWQARRAGEQQPSATPAPSATVPPLALEPVGEPTVSDTVLGTITWRTYRGELSGLTGTPHGPVALVDNDLRWLGPDGAWEGLALPWEASPLTWDGEELFTCGARLPRRLSWDGNRWAVGDPLDVPAAVRPVEQIAAGPRGTIVFGEVDFAVARDGQHFVATARPPVSLDPVEPFVLATADGFVALVTTDQSNWDSGAFEPVPWFSADGDTWEPASDASPFGEQAWINGVAGRDGRFVAVGHVGSSQGVWAAWVSDDGIDWERLAEFGSLGGSLPSGGGPYPFVGVTAGEAGWVIYSKDGSAWASADGRTWEPLGDWPAVRGMGWIPPEAALGGDALAAVGYLPGHDGAVTVIGTIEPTGKG